MARKDWDSYFHSIAVEVSTRATCARRHVGAVLVRDKAILATGYNGSVRGRPHCDEVGHQMVEGHCVRTIHAEANAVAMAARHGVSIRESTAYVTVFPCLACFQLLVQAGVVAIRHGEGYHAHLDGVVSELAKEMGVSLIGIGGG